MKTLQVFVQLLIIFCAEDFELESSAVYWATAARQYLEKHSLEANNRWEGDDEMIHWTSTTEIFQISPGEDYNDQTISPRNTLHQSIEV